MCALILGTVVGCLGDPYYIDDALGSAQSSANTAVTVPSSATASSTAPASSEMPSSSETDAGADTLTPDTSAPEPSTSDSSGGAPDAGQPNDTTAGYTGSDRDAAASNDPGEAGSPRQGAFVQGACWPMCNMADVDDVIDGWGMQYDRSCVRQNTEAPECTYDDESAGVRVDGECYAPCPGPTLDEDDDGWAEADSEACVVTGTSLAMSADPCPHP